MAKDDIFSKVPEGGYEEASDYSDPQSFAKLIDARRSCRVYTDEKVPEEIMRTCMSQALMAPSSSNLRSWQFYWVRTPETKSKLVEACLGQPAAKSAQELIVAVAHPYMWKVTRQLNLAEFKKDPSVETPKAALDYYEKLVPMLYNQGPLGIIGLIKRPILFLRGLKTATPRGPVSNADMRVWANKSTALACQQLMLSFRAHGYDTCPMEGFDEKLIAKAIKMPAKSEVCMVISVGKRDKNGIYAPRMKFDDKLFIHEV